MGGIVGLIGGTVGIVTSVRSNRREEWKAIEEQNDFSFLASFMQKQMEVGNFAGQIFTEIEIDSKLWQRAEKLVERRILERGPNGPGYRIAGFFERGPTVLPAWQVENKAVPAKDIDRN